MQKILIVEDDMLLARELKEIIETNGYKGKIIKDFRNAKKEILESNGNLILLDINIPNINGEMLLREIRKESSIPVIMVTSRDTESDEVISMSIGADDYITKPYNPTILLLRIEAILKRINNNNNKLEYRNIKLNMDKGQIETEKENIIVSKNELIILSFLIKNVGKIVSREEIIKYLWDSEEFVDDNTLTVNIKRLRNRLEQAGLTNVIETRRGQGYILK